MLLHVNAVIDHSSVDAAQHRQMHGQIDRFPTLLSGWSPTDVHTSGAVLADTTQAVLWNAVPVVTAS